MLRAEEPKLRCMQVPDFVNAKIAGRPAMEVINDERWLKEEFTPTVATRGGALIKKWGRSSAASTAVSIADAIQSLVNPTRPGDCFSTAVLTDGNPYGIAEGIVFSMPCRSTVSPSSVLLQPAGMPNRCIGLHLQAPNSLRTDAYIASDTLDLSSQRSACTCGFGGYPGRRG